ncbi:MAG: hypothetical protein ACYC1M_13945 [Armatimonadota bacterium]
METRSSDPINFTVGYPKSRLYLLIDKDATLTGGDFNIGVEREKPMEFLKQFNEDFIWKLRPDIPRHKMILTSDDGLYQLLRADGVVDSGVWLSMVKVRGVLTGFWAGNKPSMPPIPAVKITEAEARAISHAVAKDYVSKGNYGVISLWPYAFEQHKRRSLAEIHTDSLGSAYVRYHFTYRLSDRPEDDKTRFLPQLDVSVNAATGEVIHAHIIYSTIKGVQTDKPVSQFPAVIVSLNTMEATLGFPCVLDSGQVYVPLVAVQSLAKGHTVTAKAKAREYRLDGTKLELPTAIISRKGLLYLPWQALNSLPGVSAQYDAKLSKLEITTPAGKKTK